MNNIILDEDYELTKCDVCKSKGPMCNECEDWFDKYDNYYFEDDREAKEDEGD